MKSDTKKPCCKLLAVAIAGVLCAPSIVLAANYDVTMENDDGTGGTDNTLSWAILQANTVVPSGADTITLKTNVKINGVMKALLNSDITLRSDSTIRTISGENKYRPLFIKSGNVVIENLKVANGLAKGGDSKRGGGGAGMGGALFVYDGDVTVRNVTFENNNATGGSYNADLAGDGGGGMFGDATSGSGGGGLFANASGIDGAYGGNGYGGNGGSGGGDGENGGFGGGGGGALGGFPANGLGGTGGFGGGGGGGAEGSVQDGEYIEVAQGVGGAGGFGGGGGFLGNGGFGGGGGVNRDGIGGSPGYGGGYDGAGGSGFGGAMFSMKGKTTLIDVKFVGNDVTAGSGIDEVGEAGAGSAIAKDIFICTNEIFGAELCQAKVNSCGSTNAVDVRGTLDSECPIVAPDNLEITPVLSLLKKGVAQTLGLSIRNKGPVSVDLSAYNFKLTGRLSYTEQFSQPSGCASTLAEDESCTLSVVYTPNSNDITPNIMAGLEVQDANNDVQAQALLTSSESIPDAATRRLPDVLNSVTIPTLITGQEVTINWSQVGYQDAVYGLVAAFECSQTMINNNSCGLSFANRTAASEILPATSTQNPATPWTYYSERARQHNFNWKYTPSSAGPVVFRFYHRNEKDKAAGNAPLSLLIPGGLSGAGDSFNYFDNVGRRIRSTVE